MKVFMKVYVTCTAPSGPQQLAECMPISAGRVVTIGGLRETVPGPPSSVYCKCTHYPAITICNENSVQDMARCKIVKHNGMTGIKPLIFHLKILELESSKGNLGLFKFQIQIF